MTMMMAMKQRKHTSVDDDDAGDQHVEYPHLLRIA
jgi:hypothetical protein